MVRADGGSQGVHQDHGSSVGGHGVAADGASRPRTAAGTKAEKPEAKGKGSRQRSRWTSRWGSKWASRWSKQQQHPEPARSPSTSSGVGAGSSSTPQTPDGCHGIAPRWSGRELRVLERDHHIQWDKPGYDEQHSLNRFPAQTQKVGQGDKEESAAGAEVDAKARAQAKAGSRAETQAKAEAQAQAGNGGDIKTEVGTKTEAKGKAEAGAGAKAEPMVRSRGSPDTSRVLEQPQPAGVECPFRAR